MTDDRRPDPDQLLARALAAEAAAQRGELKIFFGASPGVGKTYAMLAEAKRLREQGVDVVIGIVETHGRTETAALLDGLDVLPRKQIDHRGNVLAEFDLDAALARRPSVLLVDELAHSNARGCRHPKRWQDVEELLRAGINVLTTINVQHMESLNDVVGGITGVRVRETVPDHVFDGASDVVLVDLPPEDLLRRLKEGKVYLPEQAERAIASFFRKGNLMALRELALRRTASRVDDEVRAIRAEHRTPSVWQVSDAFLVAIGAGAGEDKLVRAASRLATRLDAPWHAVYVETPALHRLPESRRRTVLDTLRLAEELGATTSTLAAQDVSDALVSYAGRHNLGSIMIGRARATRWSWPWRKPLSRRIAERAPDIDVTNVSRENATGRIDTATANTATANTATANTATDNSHGDFDVASIDKASAREYGWVVLLVAAITAVSTPLRDTLELTNIVMLFLLGVMFAGLRYSRGPVILMAVLAVASVDFFFVSPRLNFAVSDVQYVLTFIVMLSAGLLIGHLVTGLRYQLRVSQYRAERANALFEMAKALSSALTQERVAEVANNCVATAFKARSAVLVRSMEDQFEIAAGPNVVSNAQGLPALDIAIARWCLDHAEAAGTGTDTLPSATQLYLPLKAPMRTRGVLVVEPSSPRLLLVPEQRRLLETYAALVAIALERVHFVTVAQDTLVKMESERLRNSLLSALSHDLRTPLTALVGLSETLAASLSQKALPESDQALAIRRQALRISRQVSNLLEMAKLQAGATALKLDWQSLEEIVGSALEGLVPAIDAYTVTIAIDSNVPLLRCDAVMIERVLYNLLENAIKYCAPGTPIGVNAQRAGSDVVVTVWDKGQGLPMQNPAQLFDKFVRGERESNTPGVGLGLAICQSIITAHGGRIWADNRADGGAQFCFTLHIADEEPAVPTLETN